MCELSLVLSLLAVALSWSARRGSSPLPYELVRKLDLDICAQKEQIRRARAREFSLRTHQDPDCKLNYG